ncbi:MAG: BamA/TamA family outer membrane protein [Polyangiaceae bacterium]
MAPDSSTDASRPPIANVCIVAALATALRGLAGCASIPPGRMAIDSVEVLGARAVDPSDVLDKLATTESPKFLGLFRGLVYDYSIYDPSIVQRDLARVERLYRGRGFFEAHARVARIEPTSDAHVRVEIVVDEGSPVVNRDVRVVGLGALEPGARAAVAAAAAATLPKGRRFDEKAYGQAATAVSRALTDRGYAYAKVLSDARVDLVSHAIDYTFSATPGIEAVFGPITIVGLDPDGAGPQPQEISEDIVRRVMNLRTSAPYSTASIQSAEQALLDLEVFSAAHVKAQLADPPRPVVPLVVELEPTKLRALRLGVGGEFDAIKTDLHALVGWEDHDALGNLRDFTVDFVPGVVLYPTSTTDFTVPNKPFVFERLRLQLRQPAFLEARTTGFIRPEFNVYPLLVIPSPTELQNVVGYVEPKGAIGLERRFGKHVFMTVAYNVQSELPFWDKQSSTSVPILPPAVVLSFPQWTMKVDFKDDQVHPHEGFGASIDVQVAGGPFGGTAGDVRIQPDLDGYIPITHGVTLGLSTSFGLLFPFAHYGSQVQNLTAGSGACPGSGAAYCGPPTAPNLLKDYSQEIQTIYFRGFFAGGPSDNRGYPLRGITPHAFVPFLNPAAAAAQQATQSAGACTPSTPECFSPIGGFTMWEASAELRFAISGPLGTALFCDTGDASQQIADFRFRYLHMSCGGGVRYDTPVGPIRLDVAYRIPFLQLLGCPTAGDASHANSACHGDPSFGVQPNLFGTTNSKGLPQGGIPVALAFGIGEAF